MVTYYSADKINHPSVLYKYRDWDDENHKKILIDNTIYMSPPCNFEDKLDCNVPEKYPTHRELYNIFLEKSKKTNPYAGRLHHREYARKMLKITPLADPKRQNEIIEQHNKEFNGRFGIFSATIDANNAEMWEKYGNDSHGICIGFDAKKLFEVVGGGGEVFYDNEIPVIDFVLDSWEEKHIKNILFKESKWAFEKEYRLTKMWQGYPSQEDRNLSLPEGSIVEVILGKNISTENETEITELVQEKYPNAKIIKSEI